MPAGSSGRAVFVDGRPIPNFTVSADAVASGAGDAKGSNGHYAIQIKDPNVAVVQNIRARITIPYDSQNYILPLYPVDGLPDSPYSNRFLGEVKKGVVRDFVFHTSGIKPGHETPPPPIYDTTGSLNNRSAFDGGEIDLEFLNLPAGGTFQLTLTPNGPLLDGSAGQVITRTIPNVNPVHSYALYDFPLGKYTATGTLAGPGGTAQPLKIKMQVYTTPVNSGSTPLPSVPISWPFSSHYEQLNKPYLTFSL